MMNIKQKIMDMILVAIVGFSTFTGLTILASKYIEGIKEYSVVALVVVALFFIKETTIIWKDDKGIVKEH